MPGSELKAGARKLIFENSPRIFVISLIYIILITVVSWLSIRLPGNINEQDILNRIASGEVLGLGIIYTNFRPIGIVLAVFLLLIQPILDIGFASYCLKINRGHDAEFKDILNGFQIVIKTISLFVTIVALVLFWSLLLIIPGIV